MQLCRSALRTQGESGTPNALNAAKHGSFWRLFVRKCVAGIGARRRSLLESVMVPFVGRGEFVYPMILAVL